VLITLLNRWLGVQLNPHFMGVDLKYVGNFFLVFLLAYDLLLCQNFEIGSRLPREFCYWLIDIHL
jgi:hypothetical protein